MPKHQRGHPREYEEVNLGASAYLPPFRPGTRFVAQSLALILARANAQHPRQCLPASCHLCVNLALRSGRIVMGYFFHKAQRT